MATLALRAVGSFVGSFFGPVGSAIGSAIGTAAGYAIDTSLINSTRTVEGARLSQARPMSADEGHPVPLVYGHAQMTGTLIWATRLRETATTTRSGAKGLGPKTTTYAYSASFAVAIAEGPVSLIKRIWADGKEIDQRDFTIRIYLGDEAQLPDPLIQAKQGQGNAPAYRGIAYAVFEDFPLERYGNRIPQMKFEAVRSVGQLERKVKAICLIPGATEFGYSPSPISTYHGRGQATEVTRHVTWSETDFEASLDELLAVCPELEAVSLVVPWFGDDLRVGACRLRPGVTHRLGGTETQPWQTGGRTRHDGATHLVSQADGRASYGGTPSDDSVVAAIRQLRGHGLRVVLNPFIMMDIPHGNGLPDPYGGLEQAAHPWRGRMTAYPAETDATALARQQVSAFLGSVDANDFSALGGIVRCSSPDYGFRHMILHMAHLAIVAGGVDGFLLSSELVGLTRIRDHEDGFPFVAGLVDLARECRAILGPDTDITYGADWTEYAGYAPSDGSGDVFYNLDPLWSDPAVTAIGIDNYMPLTDWRDEDAEMLAPNRDGARKAGDYQAMRAALRGGEGHDWYYADIAARHDRLRLPISDGAHDKPWVYRVKDMANWWSNAHFERRSGAETGLVSPWVPQSKPIWFTELGCPAVDRGSNQPNVFPDPKSSENALPHYSSGRRDDMIQRCHIEAVLDAIGDDPVYNPWSDDGSRRMLAVRDTYLWAWDMRPFPVFPLARDVWSDGNAWLTGHWLNGRLGSAPLAEVVADIARRHGVPCAVEPGTGMVAQGAAFFGESTGRELIEAVSGLAGFDLADRWTHADGPLAAIEHLPADTVRIDPAEIVFEDGKPEWTVTRVQWSELPQQVTISHVDLLNDYKLISTATGGAKLPSPSITQDTPLILDEATARQVAEDTLVRARGADRHMEFSVPLRYAGLEPGDLIAIGDQSSAEIWQIDRMETGARVRLQAHRFMQGVSSQTIPALPANTSAVSISAGQPDSVFLDLPASDGQTLEDQFRIAVLGGAGRRFSALAASGDTPLTLRSEPTGNATTGRLMEALAPGLGSGRPMEADSLMVELDQGELESVSMQRLLSGANIAAVATGANLWEVLQFARAEEFAPSQWRLSGLLRGQGGTEDAMALGAAADSDFVLLDAAVVPAGATLAERGRSLTWKVGPYGREISDRSFSTHSVIGGMRAFLPLSPVHLKAVRDGDEMVVTWIRRGRVSADSWLGIEIPVGEESESYIVTFSSDTGTVQRTTTTPGIRMDHDALSALGLPMTISVAQNSPAFGPGIAATMVLAASD